MQKKKSCNSFPKTFLCLYTMRAGTDGTLFLFFFKGNLLGICLYHSYFHTSPTMKLLFKAQVSFPYLTYFMITHTTVLFQAYLDLSSPHSLLWNNRALTVQGVFFLSLLAQHNLHVSCYPTIRCFFETWWIVGIKTSLCIFMPVIWIINVKHGGNSKLIFSSWPFNFYSMCLLCLKTNNFL